MCVFACHISRIWVGLIVVPLDAGRLLQSVMVLTFPFFGKIISQIV